MNLLDRFFLWMLSDPAHPLLAGELKQLANGDVSLTYSAAWISCGFALSADMPLDENEYRPAAQRGRQEPCAAGAVDDARPDSWGEKVIRYLYKPGASVYDNLYFAGDERFGAIGVSTGTFYDQPSCGDIPKTDPLLNIGVKSS